MAFKKGDRVRLTKRGLERWGEDKKDWRGTVNCDCPPHTVVWDQSEGSSNHENWEITKNLNDSIMDNLVERFRLATKSEPEKSFIKAGIMYMNEVLTPEGQTLFLTYLLDKNKEDFKTSVVDPILSEKDSSSSQA